MGQASIHQPRVSYRQATLSYFIHNGTVYPIAAAPSAIFRGAVLALAPAWKNNENYSGLLACPDDLAARWFLLVALAEAERPMKLYASAEQAMQALHLPV